MTNDVLTEKQIAFLELVGQSESIVEKFYLSGGTALAGFFLQHRYSEDLDFFSETEFDPSAISAFLAKIKPKLGFQTVDYQQSFNRNLFFLPYEGAEILKTEFTYFPFTRLEQGLSEYGVSIDSLRDIAVNKLFTIYQRSQARDYVDLYFICKKQAWSIRELAKQARAKFDFHIDPIQLGTQFIKVTEARDLPRMIIKLDQAELEHFFLTEAKQLKPDVLN